MMLNPLQHQSILSFRSFCSALAMGALMVSAGTAQGESSPPSGFFGGFNNLSNTSFADFGVQQDGVDFIGVIDSNDGFMGSNTTLNSSFEFGSEEANGVFSVSGSASASSFVGMLRATGSIQVDDNTVTEDGFNTPFLDEVNGDNPDGIPSVTSFSGFATFTDRLQYGGTTAVNYNSKYIFRVTGEIRGPGAFVAIDITHGDSPTQTFFFDQEGVFNEMIVTDAFVNASGEQEFSVSVQATADAIPEFDGVGDSSSALFGSTLELIGIEVRNADTNELITTGEVTTSAGFATPITEVPEPATAGLLVIAGLMAVGRRRRRR